MQRFLLRVWLYTICLIFFGCANIGGSDKSEIPIVLGVLYNLTGKQAYLDVPSSQGALLAFEQANKSGGILGRPVQVIMENGESETSILKRKTTNVLGLFPTTTAFMGLSDTDMVLAAAPIAARNQRLFLTSGATSPRLPAQVPEYLFLACFGDNVQAAAGAEWAYHDLSARTVSILFNSSMSYTRLLQGYFQTRFQQLGGKVLSVESYTSNDMNSAIQNLQKADLIFLSAESPEEALKAVDMLRKAGISSPVLGGDGFDTVDLWAKHPEVSNVFFSTHAYLGPDNKDPKVVAFRKAFNQVFPDIEPDAFTALGYDSARLLMTAIEKAGATEPVKVRNALAGIRNYEGVTGIMKYSPGSRIPVKTVTILEIDQGKRRLVRQLLPVQVPSP